MVCKPNEKGVVMNADDKIDPFALMWTDPLTVNAMFDSLTSKEQARIGQIAGDFGRSMARSLDALIGKKGNPMLKVVVLAIMNVANQAELLTAAGFELDESGAPVEDDDVGDEPVDDSDFLDVDGDERVF